MSQAKPAIETLLAGLIDYAGLYPPANLDLRSAIGKYREYQSGKHAHALGRFIVDIDKLDELRVFAGQSRDLRLSIIVSQPGHVERLVRLVEGGMQVEAVEWRAASPGDFESIVRSVPVNIETYIEIPMEAICGEALRVIAGSGVRVKLRMGGVVAEAFPSSSAVARALETLIRERVPFKATAGLHHPIRSCQRLTYAQDSPSAVMHGFVNLVGAVALLHCGAGAAEAERLLDEDDPTAWSLTPEALVWRGHGWSAAHLGEARKIFVGFGSCSFEEPIHDLEALGWF